MTDNLDQFSETHTHDKGPQPLLKGLLVAVVVLAVGVGLLGRYLNERRTTSDQRNERERIAICAILRQIPSTGHPSISQAKTAFACH